MMFYWPSASSPVDLAEDVHIWAWSTPRETDRDNENAAILSPDERERMDRFRFSEDRRRYLTCHANLRRLLAHYAGCRSGDLGFEANEFGKPALRNRELCKPLHFNLSHSGDIGLLAVTRVGEIGADVEQMRPIEQDVAESHFSERELAELQTLTETQWLHGFFNCWTRKEAILKAEGCGLNLRLDGFDVSLLPGKPAALREVRPGGGISRRWKLENLEPAPGFAGALAVHENFDRIRCFSLMPKD